jgi:hypothetical protein
MSVQAGAPTGYAEERGAGWLLFAGVLLVTMGIFNAIDGIAAISKSHFFVADQHYVFGDLKTWGWIALILGVAQVFVGLGIFAKNQLARWAGVAVVALNSLAMLFMMPAYPFWSLAIFGVDIAVIYGLVAYGGKS